jgi:Flp pilus assembly protein TadD
VELAATGRRDRAIADFRKAIALDPADENVKKNLTELGVTP